MPDSPITTAVRLLREEAVPYDTAEPITRQRGTMLRAAADALLLLCREPDEATLARIEAAISGLGQPSARYDPAFVAISPRDIARAALRALAPTPQEQADG